MTGLIFAEYVKLRRRTFFWVLAGLIWALHVFASWLSLSVVIGSETGGSGRLVSFAELIALVLAIQVLGNEFSGGRWASGLTRDSRRGAHLCAKTVTALLGMLFIIVVAVALGQATKAMLGEDLAQLGSIAGDIGKSLLVGLVWIMIAFAINALLRGLGISFIVGFIFLNAEVLVSLWDKYEPFSVSHNIALFYGSEGGLSVMLVWGAATAVASWALLKYRDA